MKKILLILMLAGLTTFNANAGGGDMLTGGTFIHVGLLMPTNSYAVEELSNLKNITCKKCWIRTFITIWSIIRNS